MKIPTPATLKKYHITAEYYAALFELQGGVCAVCGKPPLADGLALVIDHKHFTIEYHRFRSIWVMSILGLEKPINEVEGGWLARASIFTTQTDAPWCWAKTQEAAKKAARDYALPRSIRGLLCPGRYKGCNRNLGRVDDPKWLTQAACYLSDPPASKINLGNYNATTGSTSTHASDRQFATRIQTSDH
jgi:hypothetical protein